MSWFENFYEHPKLKPYRLNPCDHGAFPVLKPFGRALAHFATKCPCCNGARVLATAASAAYSPLGTGIFLGVMYLAYLTIEVWGGPDE